MSSSERSHSAVRNLRNIFETKATTDTDTADTRGRSPAAGRLSNLDANGRPLSKVRASFVAVEPPQIPIQDAVADMASPSAGRASSMAARRASFSMDPDNKSAIADLKQDLQDEQFRRSSNPNIEAIPEGALESAASTPAIESREDQAMGDISHAASKLSQMTVAPGNENEPPMNPDKPTTGAEEEEEGSLMPAEPANEAAVSGGEAMPPVAEDLRKPEPTDSSQPKAGSEFTPTKPAVQPVTTSKDGSQKSISVPSSSSRKPSVQPSPVAVDAPKNTSQTASLKSPETAKSPTSNKSSLSPKAAPARDVTRKASRSSLAAPTAASAARTSRESFSSKSSGPTAVKPKPRETTKPADVSSRLTAPTAASRAKHEAESACKPAPVPQKPATTARKPPPSSTKPTPRSSLARPESRSSQAAARKTAPPPDGSFLERMMRPTAASANKVHEKTEVKSPPRKTASSLKKPTAPKTNGVAKPASKTSAAPKPPSSKIAEKALETATDDAPAAENSNGVVHDPSELDNASAAEPLPAGNDTPVQDKSASPTTNGALESTPAFGGEDGIR